MFFKITPVDEILKIATDHNASNNQRPKSENQYRRPVKKITLAEYPKEFLNLKHAEDSSPKLLYEPEGFFYAHFKVGREFGDEFVKDDKHGKELVPKSQLQESSMTFYSANASNVQMNPKGNDSPSSILKKHGNVNIEKIDETTEIDDCNKPMNTTLSSCLGSCGNKEKKVRPSKISFAAQAEYMSNTELQGFSKSNQTESIERKEAGIGTTLTEATTYKCCEDFGKIFDVIGSDYTGHECERCKRLEQIFNSPEPKIIVPKSSMKFVEVVADYDDLGEHCRHCKSGKNIPCGNKASSKTLFSTGVAACDAKRPKKTTCSKKETCPKKDFLLAKTSSVTLMHKKQNKSCNFNKSEKSNPSICVKNAKKIPKNAIQKNTKLKICSTDEEIDTHECNKMTSPSDEDSDDYLEGFAVKKCASVECQTPPPPSILETIKKNLIERSLGTSTQKICQPKTCKPKVSCSRCTNKSCQKVNLVPSDISITKSDTSLLNAPEEKPIKKKQKTAPTRPKSTPTFADSYVSKRSFGMKTDNVEKPTNISIQTDSIEKRDTITGEDNPSTTSLKKSDEESKEKEKKKRSRSSDRCYDTCLFNCAKEYILSKLENLRSPTPTPSQQESKQKFICISRNIDDEDDESNDPNSDVQYVSCPRKCTENGNKEIDENHRRDKKDAHQESSVFPDILKRKNQNKVNKEKQKSSSDGKKEDESNYNTPKSNEDSNSVYLSPQSLSPETLSPNTFSPNTFSPNNLSPDLSPDLSPEISRLKQERASSPYIGASRSRAGNEEFTRQCSVTDSTVSACCVSRDKSQPNSGVVCVCVSEGEDLTLYNENVNVVMCPNDCLKNKKQHRESRRRSMEPVYHHENPEKPLERICCQNRSAKSSPGPRRSQVDFQETHKEECYQPEPKKPCSSCCKKKPQQRTSCYLDQQPRKRSSSCCQKSPTKKRSSCCSTCSKDKKKSKKKSKGCSLFRCCKCSKKKDKNKCCNKREIEEEKIQKQQHKTQTMENTQRRERNPKCRSKCSVVKNDDGLRADMEAFCYEERKMTKTISKETDTSKTSTITEKKTVKSKEPKHRIKEDPAVFGYDPQINKQYKTQMKQEYKQEYKPQVKREYPPQVIKNYTSQYNRNNSPTSQKSFSPPLDRKTGQIKCQDKKRPCICKEDLDNSLSCASSGIKAYQEAIFIHPKEKNYETNAVFRSKDQCESEATFIKTDDCDTKNSEDHNKDYVYECPKNEPVILQKETPKKLIKSTINPECCLCEEENTKEQICIESKTSVDTYVECEDRKKSPRNYSPPREERYEKSNNVNEPYLEKEISGGNTCKDQNNCCKCVVKTSKKRFRKRSNQSIKSQKSINKKRKSKPKKSEYSIVTISEPGKPLKTIETNKVSKTHLKDCGNYRTTTTKEKTKIKSTEQKNNIQQKNSGTETCSQQDSVIEKVIQPTKPNPCIRKTILIDCPASSIQVCYEPEPKKICRQREKTFDEDCYEPQPKKTYPQKQKTEDECYEPQPKKTYSQKQNTFDEECYERNTFPQKIIDKECLCSEPKKFPQKQKSMEVCTSTSTFQQQPKIIEARISRPPKQTDGGNQYPEKVYCSKGVLKRDSSYEMVNCYPSKRTRDECYDKYPEKDYSEERNNGQFLESGYRKSLKDICFKNTPEKKCSEQHERGCTCPGCLHCREEKNFWLEKERRKKEALENYYLEKDYRTREARKNRFPNRLVKEYPGKEWDIPKRKPSRYNKDSCDSIEQNKIKIKETRFSPEKEVICQRRRSSKTFDDDSNEVYVDCPDTSKCSVWNYNQKCPSTDNQNEHYKRCLKEKSNSKFYDEDSSIIYDDECYDKQPRIIQTKIMKQKKSQTSRTSMANNNFPKSSNSSGVTFQKCPNKSKRASQTQCYPCPDDDVSLCSDEYDVICHNKNQYRSRSYPREASILGTLIDTPITNLSTKSNSVSPERLRSGYSSDIECYKNCCLKNSFVSTCSLSPGCPNMVSSENSIENSCPFAYVTKNYRSRHRCRSKHVIRLHSGATKKTEKRKNQCCEEFNQGKLVTHQKPNLQNVRKNSTNNKKSTQEYNKKPSQENKKRPSQGHRRSSKSKPNTQNLKSRLSRDSTGSRGSLRTKESKQLMNSRESLEPRDSKNCKENRKSRDSIKPRGSRKSCRSVDNKKSNDSIKSNTSIKSITSEKKEKVSKKQSAGSKFSTNYTLDTLAQNRGQVRPSRTPSYKKSMSSLTDKIKAILKNHSLASKRSRSKACSINCQSPSGKCEPKCQTTSSTRKKWNDSIENIEDKYKKPSTAQQSTRKSNLEKKNSLDCCGSGAIVCPSLEIFLKELREKGKVKSCECNEKKVHDEKESIFSRKHNEPENISFLKDRASLIANVTSGQCQSGSKNKDCKGNEKSPTHKSRNMLDASQEKPDQLYEDIGSKFSINTPKICPCYKTNSQLELDPNFKTDRPKSSQQERNSTQNKHQTPERHPTPERRSTPERRTSEKRSISKKQSVPEKSVYSKPSKNKINTEEIEIKAFYDVVEKKTDHCGCKRRYSGREVIEALRPTSQEKHRSNTLSAIPKHSSPTKRPSTKSSNKEKDFSVLIEPGTRLELSQKISKSICEPCPYKDSDTSPSKKSLEVKKSERSRSKDRNEDLSKKYSAKMLESKVVEVPNISSTSKGSFTRKVSSPTKTNRISYAEELNFELSNESSLQDVPIRRTTMEQNSAYFHRVSEMPVREISKASLKRASLGPDEEIRRSSKTIPKKHSSTKEKDIDSLLNLKFDNDSSFFRFDKPKNSFENIQPFSSKCRNCPNKRHSSELPKRKSSSKQFSKYDNRIENKISQPEDFLQRKKSSQKKPSRATYNEKIEDIILFDQDTEGELENIFQSRKLKYQLDSKDDNMIGVNISGDTTPTTPSESGNLSPHDKRLSYYYEGPGKMSVRLSKSIFPSQEETLGVVDGTSDSRSPSTSNDRPRRSTGFPIHKIYEKTSLQSPSILDDDDSTKVFSSSFSEHSFILTRTSKQRLGKSSDSSAMVDIQKSNQPSYKEFMESIDSYLYNKMQKQRSEGIQDRKTSQEEKGRSSSLNRLSNQCPSSCRSKKSLNSQIESCTNYPKGSRILKCEGKKSYCRKPGKVHNKCSGPRNFKEINKYVSKISTELANRKLQMSTTFQATPRSRSKSRNKLAAGGINPCCEDHCGKKRSRSVVKKPKRTLSSTSRTTCPVKKCSTKNLKDSTCSPWNTAQFIWDSSQNHDKFFGKRHRVSKRNISTSMSKKMSHHRKKSECRKVCSFMEKLSGCMEPSVCGTPVNCRESSICDDCSLPSFKGSICEVPSPCKMMSPSPCNTFRSCKSKSPCRVNSFCQTNCDAPRVCVGHSPCSSANVCKVPSVCRKISTCRDPSPCRVPILCNEPSRSCSRVNICPDPSICKSLSTCESRSMCPTVGSICTKISSCSIPCDPCKPCSPCKPSPICRPCSPRPCSPSPCKPRKKCSQICISEVRPCSGPPLCPIGKRCSSYSVKDAFRKLNPKKSSRLSYYADQVMVKCCGKPCCTTNKTPQNNFVYPKWSEPEPGPGLREYKNRIETMACPETCEPDTYSVRLQDLVNRKRMEIDRLKCKLNRCSKVCDTYSSTRFFSPKQNFTNYRHRVNDMEHYGSSLKKYEPKNYTYPRYRSRYQRLSFVDDPPYCNINNFLTDVTYKYMKPTCNRCPMDLPSYQPKSSERYWQPSLPEWVYKNRPQIQDWNF